MAAGARQARLRAIGRLGRGGAWFGYRCDADGPRLVFGERGVIRPAPGGRQSRRRDVAVVAIAYFEEAAAGPPPELEAMQLDLAEAVRWLAAGEPDDARRRLLGQAVDAIDDGLRGEAISTLLRQAMAESGDSLELLAQRYRSRP